MVRRKDRYFVCEVIDPNNPSFSSSSSSGRSSISRETIQASLTDSVRDCHGIHGLAVLEPERGVVRVKHVNPATSVVIFRCLRAHHRLFWSALTFIRSIGEKECFFNTIFVGATLKSCERFVIKHHRRKLTEMLGKTKDMNRRVELQRMIKESCDGVS